MDFIVYGGGTYYRDVLNAVAMMAGGSAIDSLLRLTMVLGLIMGMLKAAFDFDIGKIIKWFLMATMIYGVLWVPKVQLQVIDKFDASMPGGAVADVPLGVGFTAALASEVGSRVIELTETVFADPQDFQYSTHGMIFGAKWLQRLNTVKPHDAMVDKNLNGFIQNCVYYDILSGEYTAKELAASLDAWSFVTATHTQNPARAMLWYTASNASTIKTCAEAVPLLEAGFATDVPAVAKDMAAQLSPETPAGNRLDVATQTLDGLNNYIWTAGSTTALQTLRQAMFTVAIRDNVRGFAAQGGSGAMVMASAFAETQTHNTQSMLGTVSQKAIPIIKIVVDLLFIGMFPIMFPAFLLPSIGPKMVQGYLAGFIYLQLWGPMFVILNKIMMGAIYAQTAAGTALDGVTSGLSLSNIGEVSAINSDIGAVAGGMMLMIPVLAGMLTKGAAAVGGAGESLVRSFSSGAEAAASNATTGNWSLGNTSIGNQDFNNARGNKEDTSELHEYGGVTNRTASGGLDTKNRDGSHTIQAAQSSTAVNVRLAESVASAAQVRASETKAIETSATDAWVKGASKTHQQVAQEVHAWTSGVTHSTGRTNSEMGSQSELQSSLESASRSYAQSQGVSVAHARQVIGRVAATAGVEGKMITPIPGVGVHAGLNGGVEGNVSNTRGTNSRDEAAYRALVDSGFTSKVEHLQSQNATEAWGRTQGVSDTSSQISSDSFASYQRFDQTRQNLRSQGERYEQLAETSRSNSASMEMNYGNQFVNFARSELLGRDDAYGVKWDDDRVTGLLANRGMNPGDDELLASLAHKFSSSVVESQIATPPEISNSRAASVDLSAQSSAPTALPASHHAGEGPRLHADRSGSLLVSQVDDALSGGATAGPALPKPQHVLSDEAHTALSEHTQGLIDRKPLTEPARKENAEAGAAQVYGRPREPSSH